MHSAFISGCDKWGMPMRVAKLVVFTPSLNLSCLTVSFPSPSRHHGHNSYRPFDCRPVYAHVPPTFTTSPFVSLGPMAVQILVVWRLLTDSRDRQSAFVELMLHAVHFLC